ncbi:MAG: hypothetical protein ABI666_11545 [Ferruginibacter sp.]
MSEDLISNNFADNINRNVIKRNIRLLFVVIILFSVYTIFNFIDWYMVMAQANPLRKTIFTFYSYWIRPLVFLITLILGFTEWVYYIKGHKLILLSFEKDNVDFFNKGYSFLNKATILNIIGYSLIILSFMFRYFLKYSSPNL